MDTAPYLEFTHNESLIRFSVVETSREPSPFTGRELRSLATDVRVAPKDADMVKEFLSAGAVTASDGSRWSGRITVESYSDSSPHNLQIEWKEAEDLMATTIKFEGLSFVPTEYEERLNEDASICVSFRAPVTADELGQLNALVSKSAVEPRYFPVVRAGVSDEPRSMRLGARSLWQQLDGNVSLREITLVDEAYDASEQSSTLLRLAGEPFVGNLIRETAALTTRVDALIAELQAAGALTPDAVERIRAITDSLDAARYQVFSEVDDLSKW